MNILRSLFPGAVCYGDKDWVHGETPGPPVFGKEMVRNRGVFDLSFFVKGIGFLI